MRQMMKRLVAIAVCAVIGGLLMVALTRYGKGEKVMGETKLPVIEVWLMESVNRIKGRPWPTYNDGRPLEITAMEEPCELIVHLPSGREIRMAAKAVTFDQEDGVVTQVSPLPLMELVEYRQAVAEVKRIAAELKVDTDPKLQATLREWQDQNPEPDIFNSNIYMTKTKLEKGVLLYLEIKVHPSERRWYVVVDFTRPARGESE